MPKKKPFTTYRPPAPGYRRDENSPHIHSLEPTQCITSKAKQRVYNGDYIVGIATMHKSNLVPVGKGDNPVNYSTMRRM